MEGEPIKPAHDEEIVGNKEKERIHNCSQGSGWSNLLDGDAILRQESWAVEVGGVILERVNQGFCLAFRN